MLKLGSGIKYTPFAVNNQDKRTSIHTHYFPYSPAIPTTRTSWEDSASESSSFELDSSKLKPSWILPGHLFIGARVNFAHWWPFSVSNFLYPVGAIVVWSWKKRVTNSVYRFPDLSLAVTEIIFIRLPFIGGDVRRPLLYDI